MKASIVLPALFIVLISVLRYAHSYQECTCFTDCKDLTDIQNRLSQRLVISKKAKAYVTNTRRKLCGRGTKCCVEDLSSAGWTWHNNSWNKIVPYNGKLIDTRSVCEKHGARLVRVTSASHHIFLRKLAQSKLPIIDAKGSEHFDGTPLIWKPPLYIPSGQHECARILPHPVKVAWSSTNCDINFNSQVAACEILS